MATLGSVSHSEITRKTVAKVLGARFVSAVVALICVNFIETDNEEKHSFETIGRYSKTVHHILPDVCCQDASLGTVREKIQTDKADVVLRRGKN